MCVNAAAVLRGTILPSPKFQFHVAIVPMVVAELSVKVSGDFSQTGSLTPNLATEEGNTVMVFIHESLHPSGEI